MLSRNDFKRERTGGTWPTKNFYPTQRDEAEMILNKKKVVLLLQNNLFKIGGDILSQSLEPVPSALRGLTSLFGMGRGGHPCYNHHKTITHGYESILWHWVLGKNNFLCKKYFRAALQEVFGQLVLVNFDITAFTFPAYQPGSLPGSWYGKLILKSASRLDAFSAYPFRT